MKQADLRLGVAGLGAVGGEVARRVAQGDVPGMALAGGSSRTCAAAAVRLKAMASSAPALEISELAEACDVVLECAPAASFMTIAEPVLAAGRTLVALSAGAVLENLDTIAARGRVLVPSGAIAGLDVIRAACADGGVERVRLSSRKPPSSLAQGRADLTDLDTPLRVFHGDAAAAARAFPANANIAAAVALAVGSAEAVEVEIWADPATSRNQHALELDAPAVRLRLEISSTALADNPRTSRLACASALAALRRLTSRLEVGS